MTFLRPLALTAVVVAATLAVPTASDAVLRPAATQATQAAPPPAVARSTPKVTKLLVVVEENHSMAEMRKGMPYAASLADKYGYATNYVAISHPSLPNYVAIAGGSTYGITDDADPSAHPLRGTSVFGQALAHHRTASLYAQAMPRPCATSSAGNYAVRHNPWAYFVNERAQCAQHDVGLKRFSGDVTQGALPRVGMLVPDVQHDAHDGTLAAADAWFKTVMTSVFAGPDWKSGHLAVVLTADEDDHSAGNRVLTVVIHRSQHHHVVTRKLGHYSLTRLYDEVAGLRYLRSAKTAPSMAEAFGLPVG